MGLYTFRFSDEHGRLTLVTLFGYLGYITKAFNNIKYSLTPVTIKWRKVNHQSIISFISPMSNVMTSENSESDWQLEHC